MTQSAPAAPIRPASSELPGRAPTGLGARLLVRPEVGALVAAIAIFVFFLAVAPAFRSPESLFTVLYQASTIGIVAVGVGLLMIGGEFDLSAGVITTTAGLAASLFCWWFGVNLWAGALLSLIFHSALFFALATITRSMMATYLGVVSFTSGFFVLQGANLGVTKLVTGSVTSPDVTAIAGFDSLQAVFSSSFKIGPVTVWGTVLWWVLFVALAAWILHRTRPGNWVYAVGGALDSARAVGVPTMKTKIGLFMGVSFLGWFVGMHTLFRFNTLQAGNGVGNEFLYIIAAVVGGTLLTGGFGNAIGVAIGAFIFGMTSLGIVYAGWDPNWFKAFLGVMLLLAVMVNLYVKRIATGRKAA